MSRLVERAALKGRKAVIVGGASGIGAAATLALAQEGVDVAFCDILQEALEPTRAQAETQGVKAIACQADAIDRAALGRFYDLVEAEFGSIDILVNLAGGTLRRAFAEGDADADERDIRRNYGYVLDSTRRAIPLITKSGKGGSIINFTTIEAHRGAASFAVYAGAKAATTNFTAALAVELGGQGIRVNCIAPDTTPSAGNANAVPGITESFASLPAEVAGRGMAMYVPLKRVPMPEDLADAVVFLASDLSRFVSGITLHVDGGTKAASGFIDWPFGDGFVPTPLAGTLGAMFRDR